MALANAGVAHAMHTLLNQMYKPDEPSIAVIVVRDGEVLLRKGYGMANLELGAPIEPDMVFRLGSITKQFTAVAILMLVEEGKLSLQDDITWYLPNYPTHGQTITIEQLLTHTSGIPSYTDMPEFWQKSKDDLSHDELIALFKDQLLEFSPGTQWKYSNSGYYLLGVIIERRLDSQSYEDFIRTRIFEPLGMVSSSYDRPTRIIARRASGYDRIGKRFQNTGYISMNPPFAAGALAPTVDDLAKWDAALYTDQLVSQTQLQQAFSSHKLPDGRDTHYGYGWGISAYNGHKIIEHGGGIHGFSTYVLRIPDSRTFVALLNNGNVTEQPASWPDNLAFRLAAMAINEPWQEPRVMGLDNAALAAFVGVYDVDSGDEITIYQDGSKLFVKRPFREDTLIYAMSSDELFIRDELVRYQFARDATGAMTGFTIYRCGEPFDKAAKTDKPLPQTKV